MLSNLSNHKKKLKIKNKKRNMNALNNIIRQLNQAISTNSHEAIQSLEKVLSEKLSESSQIPLFYSLPLENILHIVEISESSPMKMIIKKFFQ